MVRTRPIGMRLHWLTADRDMLSDLAAFAGPPSNWIISGLVRLTLMISDTCTLGLDLSRYTYLAFCWR